jgi:hypothetical protein
MCTENKVKRIDKQKTAEETAAVSSCKIRSSKKNDGDKPVTDKKDEKEEKKYEFAIKVINAANKQGIKKIKVGVTIDNVEYPYTTDENGRIKLPAKSGGIERSLNVLLRPGSKYTVKGSGHKVKSQEVGGSSTTIELEKQMLEIKSLDDHFVPTGKADAENLEIKYTIAKIASISPKPDVFLCISCDEPILGYEVYKYQLKDNEIADGSYMLKWDGKTNCSSGPLKNKMVNPLCGALEVKIEVRQGTKLILESNKMETRVLYHSIKLKEASWLEDPGNPPQRMTAIPPRDATNVNWQKYIKWVQFRLNTLGYFAGPVNGVENVQTKRAIKRYTYEMIDMPETDDPRNAKFSGSLAGDKLKVDLFEDQSVITDPGKKSKIFIQHNYFYHTEGKVGTTNFNVADGHYDKENNHADPKGGKLDRFEFPLEAKVTLISRTDATGDPDQSAGIDAPEAMGDVKIKWTVVDPPEDFSVLPPYDALHSPSWAKKFVKDVNANVLALGGGDNCPEQCGGVKSTEFYFEQCIPQIIITQGGSNKTAATSLYDGGTTPVADWEGKTAVLFKGSNIGGDNFRVEASISFEELSNKNDLIAAHAKGRKADVLEAKTGEMTVWRLHRVACGVEWHDLPIPPIDWNSLKPAYEAAFCMLDTSATTSNKVSQMLANPNDADPFLTLVAEEKISKYDYYNLVVDTWVLKPGIALDARQKAIDKVKEQLAIDDACIFPYKVEKGKKETEAVFRGRISQLVADFKGVISRISTGSETNGSIGDFFAKLNNKTKRPGIISLRTIIYKGLDTEDNITQKGLIFNKKVKVPVKLFREEGETCTGVGGGAIFIGGDRAKQLKDDFLISHEVGHLYYLSHPFQKPEEHDSNDDNCTMWYLYVKPDHPKANNAPPNRKGVDLKPGSQNKSHFCGKCLLKLRGWKINTLNSPNITVIPPGANKVIPTPCNPVMRFVEYKVQEGEYFAQANGVQSFYPLKRGAVDPENPDIPLGPMQFLHVHELKWESTDGDLRSLKGIKTREKVVYDKPTQGSPFCLSADPDQDFVQDGDDAEKGLCKDDHSVMWPGLICANPRVAGIITAKQEYQYHMPPYTPGTWVTMPDAVFKLEKEVFEKTPGNWVLRFRKSNYDANTPTFLFEVEYKIGLPPDTLPLYTPNPTAQKLTGKNFGVNSKGNAAIFHAGPTKANYKSTGDAQTVTLQQLEEWGFIA